MTRWNLLLVLAAGLSLALSGCPEGEATQTDVVLVADAIADAGRGSDADAGSEADADAGSVADADAGSVADADAGSVADADAGSVADADAGSVADADAGSVADADADAVTVGDADAVADADAATVADADDDPDADADAVQPDASEPLPVKRVVMAGDSWSTGLVNPTIDALADLGYNVPLTWETTAIAGSRADEWVSNQDGKLDALAAALDADPPAEILLVTLGGNDMNKAAVDQDLGELPNILQDTIMDGIRDDLQAFTAWALAGRPHLTVVFVGYDFLHYELLNAFISLSGFDTKSYNEILIELETRKRDFCVAMAGCEYAHNLGILQHTYGDYPHPPFTTPLISYDPGFLPAPGWAPSYEPWPGGFVDLPAPLDHMPDGIHPSPQGFRTIIDHTFAQGLSNLMDGNSWY